MASYILRPNADWDNATAFTQTGGGGSAWSCISDSSDASFLTRASSTVPASYVSEFGTQTLGAGEVITSVNLRARVAIGTFGLIQLSIGTITDRNGHAVSYSIPITKQLAASISTIDLALYLPQSPTGKAWDQTALDNLVVSFTDGALTSGDRSTLYELYLDVVTTSVPTTTVTAPTGVLASTSYPSVLWTFAQADGYAQSAYECKIFDSATYGGGGFSADTSTPVMQTGQVVSANYGVTFATALPNSASYRAYVRTASLVNGSNQFSAWAFSSFSVAIQSPAVPTLSAFYDSTKGAVAVTVFGRTNFLSANQADLETDTTGWILLSNCAISRSTAQFSSGVASLAMVATASADATAMTTLATAFPITPSYKFSAIANFRANTTGRSCVVGIRWLDSTNTLISTSFGTGVSDTSGGWISASVTDVAPPTASTAQVVVKITSAGAGETHYVDQIAFHAGDTPIWSKGGFSGFTFDVQRSSDSGVTYTTIRNSPATASSSQIGIIYDYEAPVGSVVLYRSKAIANPSAPVTSAYVTSAPLTVSIAGTWIFVAPANTAIRLVTMAVRQPLASRIVETTGTFKPLGGNKTIVVATSQYGIDGDYEFTLKGETDWAALYPLLKYQGTLWVQDPLGRQKYVRFLTRDWTEEGPITGLIRKIKISYVEVSAP